MEISKSKDKFRVYQNPALESALSVMSLRPSILTLTLLISTCFASFIALLFTIFGEESLEEIAASQYLLQFMAHEVTIAIRMIVALVFLATIMALVRAIFLKSRADSVMLSKSPPKTKSPLTKHQQGLLGLVKKNNDYPRGIMSTPDSGIRQRPQKHKPVSPSSASFPLLVPVHPPNSSAAATPSGPTQRVVLENKEVRSPSSDTSSPTRTMRAIPLNVSALPEREETSPWANQRTRVIKDDISTEEKLEEFLADLEEKMTESAKKAAEATKQGVPSTPVQATLHGGNSPGCMTGRGTPVRTVRMSPSQQKKFNASPIKGDGEVPPPMSMEQSIDAFRSLGIYPQIEEWRDRLRHWFSEVLLNPLVQKIETSHILVIQAAAKLGVSLHVTQVGSNLQNTTGSGSANEWPNPLTMDEDVILHQFRAALIQARDSPPAPQPSLMGLQPPKEKPFNPLLQECVDAVTEHQRLRSLMKGEWVKGLLPQSSVRADYTVQRIKELAEGSCVKNFEYEKSGQWYDKASNKWALELPTDSHLLLYLFCALLEHPQWMLHVDPSSYPMTHSGNNPLFVNKLPSKERFPEKYVAILSSPPDVLHPGACILVVGKQSPATFALYWDKKLQFSLQGRTAFWDAILLLSYRIKVAHGGMVRGISLASSALNLFSVIDLQAQNDES